MGLKQTEHTQHNGLKIVCALVTFCCHAVFGMCANQVYSSCALQCITPPPSFPAPWKHCMCPIGFCCLYAPEQCKAQVHNFVLSVSSGAAMELATILAPRAFLPLACTANLAKNLAAVAASSTRAPIYRTFALQNNLVGGSLMWTCFSKAFCPQMRQLLDCRLACLVLVWKHPFLQSMPTWAPAFVSVLQADVTAKGESVANLADIAGTIAGIMLSKAKLPMLPTFIVLSAGYLIASRKEVDSVELPYLNRARLAYTSTRFLTTGVVPGIQVWRGGIVLCIVDWGVTLWSWQHGPDLCDFWVCMSCDHGTRRAGCRPVD